MHPFKAMKNTQQQPNEPKENRTRIVQFRLTEADYDRLKREADKAGIVPNECARVKATGKAMTIRQTQEIPFAVTYELNRIGVNLNQIARRLHMTDEYDPTALTAACERLNELLQIILAAATR